MTSHVPDFSEPTLRILPSDFNLSITRNIAVFDFPNILESCITLILLSVLIFSITILSISSYRSVSFRIVPHRSAIVPHRSVVDIKSVIYASIGANFIIIGATIGAIGATIGVILLFIGDIRASIGDNIGLNGWIFYDTMFFLWHFVWHLHHLLWHFLWHPNYIEISAILLFAVVCWIFDSFAIIMQIYWL